MNIITLYGPNLSNRTPSKISDVKKGLKDLSQDSNVDEILLQINAHGSKNNNNLELLNENGEKISVPLSVIINNLTIALSSEQKEKIKIDVFACHVGSNVQPTLKLGSESQTETQYEKELSEVLKNSGITLILNGGKYPTPGTTNYRLIKESENKEIEEILLERMLEPSTLKLAVNDGGEETQFIKFGAVKLKNIPDNLSSEQKREFIKNGLIERINQMAEFLKTQNPEKTKSIDEIKDNLIAEKFSEANAENFINEYLNKALIVEILKADNGDIAQRIKNIKMLLGMGANLDWQDIDKNTPLHFAVLFPDLGLIKTLVDAGADVNKPDIHGITPLRIAAQNGNFGIAEFLIKCGAKLDEILKTGKTLIYTAVECNNLGVLRTFISYGADTDTPDNNGITPLYLAAQKGYTPLAQELINCKANLNQPNKDGSTPIFAATQNGHLDIVKALIEAGADVNLANNQGNTPLQSAVLNNNCDLAKLLLNRGSDTNKANKSNLTPIYFAASRGFLEMVEILIKFKLDQLKNQQTDPEVLSSSNTFFENVEKLLKDGQIKNGQVTKALSDGLAEFKKLTNISETKETAQKTPINNTRRRATVEDLISFLNPEKSKSRE